MKYKTFYPYEKLDSTKLLHSELGEFFQYKANALYVGVNGDPQGIEEASHVYSLEAEPWGEFDTLHIYINTVRAGEIRWQVYFGLESHDLGTVWFTDDMVTQLLMRHGVDHGFTKAMYLARTFCQKPFEFTGSDVVFRPFEDTPFEAEMRQEIESRLDKGFTTYKIGAASFNVHIDGLYWGRTGEPNMRNADFPFCLHVTEGGIHIPRNYPWSQIPTGAKSRLEHWAKENHDHFVKAFS